MADFSYENLTFTDLDAGIAAEIQPHLPERIFDSHAHLHRADHVNSPRPNFWTDDYPLGRAADWRRRLEQLVGKGCLVGGLFTTVPMVNTQDMPAENEWLAAQLAAEPDSRALLIIAPDSSPEQVAAMLKRPGIVGLKPYHVHSNEKPTYQASIASFLPEWAWKLADEHGLLILLHMVKDLAMADPDNQREIYQKCRTYKNARLILAHAARGFRAENTIKGIAALRGLENVWFDMAAVCESAAMKPIVEEFGPRRLMFGSDFPVSAMRSRCVSAGDGFAWMDPGTMNWQNVAVTGHPTLVGLESLRALLEAISDLGLNAEDKQDIFCDNALRLLGIKTESGTQTQDLYRHAKQRIPGGVQLLSKRPEQMAPNQWPAYFREARGCETWDLDGRHYYDFSYNAIAACLLGFRDPDVTAAVRRRITLGSMCTLNAPEEVALADRLCEIHPWAEQVRFARCGGEIGAIAVRIARATTDRSIIAICGYHGWQDWYLAANLGEDDALRGHLLPGLEPLGVPRELRGTSVTFAFNDEEGLQSVLKTYGDRLAAVIMEPARHNDPAPGFLEAVRAGTQRVGALLIMDEISIGWRLNFGGAHMKFGIRPDLAIFAKAMGNGHPIAAVIGTKEAMAGAHTSFISSTYWTESVGPAAALATLDKLSKLDVPGYIANIGNQVMDIWQEMAAKHGLPLVTHEGYPCFSLFRFDHPQADALRTLFTQAMLGRGFLASAAFYPTMAHTNEHVALYREAVDGAFAEIAKAIDSGDILTRLNGPVAHSGFRRLVS